VSAIDLHQTIALGNNEGGLFGLDRPLGGKSLNGFGRLLIEVITVSVRVKLWIGDLGDGWVREWRPDCCQFAAQGFEHAVQGDEHLPNVLLVHFKTGPNVS
jgi:hypothetical protein